MAKRFNIQEWQKKHLNEGFRVSQNPTYGQGFDAGLKKAGGFSDEEMDDITSRDIGSPFPGEPLSSGGTKDATDMIDTIKDMYRQNDDQWMDDFIKEMVDHFMETTQGMAAAKVAMARKEL
jgi:hypothetical protein